MGNKTGQENYNMDLSNKLGEGSFGKVYKITTKHTNIECAAKIFLTPKEDMKPFEKLGYEKEI